MPMLYHPPRHFISDTYVVRWGDEYHAFSGVSRNDAPWDFGLGGMSIGHSTSRSVMSWGWQGEVLGPGAPGMFDDLAVNVGCARKHGSEYFLFYWGRARGQGVTAIGLARSDDLRRWTRVSAEPILMADGRRYENEVRPDGNGGVHSAGVRDPFVFQVPGDSRWHMFFAARTTAGPLDGRGCVGHAVSDDLLAWRIQDPVIAPGWFSEMEVPQAFTLAGRWFLHFYCNSRYWMGELGRRNVAPSRQIPATFLWQSENPLNGYQPGTPEVLVGNEGNYLHSLVPRVFDNHTGGMSLVHFHFGVTTPDGSVDEVPGPLSLPKQVVWNERWGVECSPHPGIAAMRTASLLARAEIDDFRLLTSPGVWLRSSLSGRRWAMELWADRIGRGGYTIHIDQGRIEVQRYPDGESVTGRITERVDASSVTLIVADGQMDVYLDDAWQLTTPVARGRVAIAKCSGSTMDVEFFGTPTELSR